MGTVAVWRRLHAPPDRDMAASEPESQDSVVGTRDADGRALLDSKNCVLQARLSAVCRCALSSECNTRRISCGCWTQISERRTARRQPGVA